MAVGYIILINPESFRNATRILRRNVCCASFLLSSGVNQRMVRGNL